VPCPVTAEGLAVPCGASSTGPDPAVFEEDWWLDAAAPGAWDRVEVSWSGAKVGDMAYHVQRRWGLRYIRMPHLTRTMSPRFYIPSRKPVLREISARTIVRELMAKLPRHDRFERALNPGCPSVHGFAHANLPVTHLFTFRSQEGDDPDTMLQRAHREARRVIVKAARECAVERVADLDRFIRLHRRAWSDTSLTDYATVARIYDAAAVRRQAEILFVSFDGRDAAAAILVWDRNAVYTWLLARDSESSGTGASSLLFFESMRTAHRLGRILDFDGYVRPAVGSFLMRFGLRPAVRPYVNGSNNLWRCCRAVTTLFSPGRGDKYYRVG
jgi:hypothetical protein